MALLLIIKLDETKHMVNHLFRDRDVPYRKRTFAAVANGGREHRVTLDRKLNGLELRRRVLEKRDGERGLHDDFGRRGRVRRDGGRSGRRRVLEEEERAEHVFVCLVVARTEDELGVGVVVQYPFDNLSLRTPQSVLYRFRVSPTRTHLVDSNRANLEILLADENLDRPLTCEVILQ